MDVPNEDEDQERLLGAYSLVMSTGPASDSSEDNQVIIHSGYCIILW